AHRLSFPGKRNSGDVRCAEVVAKKRAIRPGTDPGSRARSWSRHHAVTSRVRHSAVIQPADMQNVQSLINRRFGIRGKERAGPFGLRIQLQSYREGALNLSSSPGDVN